MNKLIVEILRHAYEHKNHRDDGVVLIPNPEGYTPQEIEVVVDFCGTAGYLEVIGMGKPTLDGVAGSIRLTKQGEDYLHAQLRES